MKSEQIQGLMQMGHVISTMVDSGPKLAFKKQLNKFLDQLISKQPIKYYYQCVLIQLIQNCIDSKNVQNLLVQQKIVTIVLKFLEIEQPQSCDSQELCHALIRYIKFLIYTKFDDSYIYQQLCNIISLIFLKKKIYEIQTIEIKDLCIGELSMNLSLKPMLFSNKTFQQLFLAQLVQYNDLQSDLLQINLQEINNLVLELSTFYYNIPFQCLKNEIMLENKKKFMLLPFQQQLEILLSNNEFDCSKLDTLIELVIQNETFDISNKTPQIIYLCTNSQDIDFDKAYFLIKKISRNQKFILDYEILSLVLNNSTNKKLNQFILDIIQTFEINKDIIIEIEIIKPTLSIAIVQLISQIIDPKFLPFLLQKLIDKSITPQQYIFLHTLLLIYDINIQLNELEEQCMQFTLSDINLIQLYSLYSFQNLGIKRKIQLLHQFQQQIDCNQNITFYDILSIIGSSPNQQPIINNKIGRILNQEWNNISNFLKQIGSPKKQLILQGFYYVVMFFTDKNESEFLRLYDIVHKSLYTRNKVLNYKTLLESIKQFQLGNIESEIKLYIILLKINYILSNVFPKRGRIDEISERSSEVADNNDELENQILQLIQEEGIKLMQYFDRKIKLFEQSQLGLQDQTKISQAIEIQRLISLSEIKYPICHSLLKDEKILNLINETNITENEIIWNALKDGQVVALATSVIQIFKNEKSVKIIKILSVELNKICKYKYFGQIFKNYDLLFIQQNKSQQLNKIENLKLLIHKYTLAIQIKDNYEFLKYSLLYAQKNTIEQLALLIAISLQCGITHNLIENLSQVNDICINKLIVEFSEAGLLSLVLTLVKPIKQQKKKKQQQQEMEIEKKLEDYLNNSISEAINIVLIAIQKYMNNQDLRIEFINLATKVYQVGNSQEYQLIFDLFDKVPEELIMNCLNSININDQQLDAKLQHILKLIQSIDNKTLQPEFFEISYNVILNSQQQSQTIIDFCFQLINMIKMKENQKISINTHVEITQLQEILIPERFQPTFCTQQQTSQHLYICNQCPNGNKRNLVCCASCAFGCHQNHQIQYEGQQEGNCECNSTKKCVQQRQRQSSQLLSYRRQLLNSNPSEIIQILRRDKERDSLREIRDLERQQQLLEMSLVYDTIHEFDSEKDEQEQDHEPEQDQEKDQEESGTSSQLQFIEESLDLNEKSSLTSHSLMEIEQIQQEQKIDQPKNNIQTQTYSEYFKNLNINFQQLFNRLFQMCHLTIENTQIDIQPTQITEQQEFELQLQNTYPITKVNIFYTNQNSSQIKIDNIEIIFDFRKALDFFQQKQHQSQQFYVYLPFQIRKLMDQCDQFTIICSQQEVRIIKKNQLITAIEKKASQNPIVYTKINLKYPIQSAIFNPYNNKQLAVCGLHDIHIIEIKQDSSIQSDKTILTKFQNIISKILWASQNLVSWLSINQIYLYNLITQKEYVYTLDIDDKKIKDYCVINGYILSVDMQGEIYCQKIQEFQILKFNFTEKPTIPEQMKGKSKDRIPYCLAVIPQTKIILISYKNGTSCITNFENGQFFNIIRLDELLQSLSIDGLLSSPQLLSQNKQFIKFTVLAQKQNFSSQQLNFHQGKLLIIELTNKGNINVQQIFETQTESYTLVNMEQNFYVVALQENKQCIGALLNIKDTKQINFQEKKSENQEQLLNQLKEKFDLNVLKQGLKYYSPLQYFCLQPSSLATPQQLQLGSTSITITQGYAITGLIFNKPSIDQVEILKYRTVQKKGTQIIIPFNYLEQIYTYLNHTVTFTQIQYHNVQVYIQKMNLSQVLTSKLLQILNQENHSQYTYIYQDLKTRYTKLKQLIQEPQIKLINCLDCLGITLQAYPNKEMDYKLVPKLCKLIQGNQTIVMESANKLLKIILKNYQAQLGSDFHYKSIQDRIFIEKIKTKQIDSPNLILNKLYKISTKRTPQIFYLFNQLPTILLEIISEQTNFKIFCQIFIKYLLFLLNSKKDVNEIFQQIEDIKQTWKLPNQTNFNKTLVDELQQYSKNGISETFDYAWDVFIKESKPQSDKIEVESYEEPYRLASPFVDIDEIADSIQDEFEQIQEAMLREQGHVKHQKKQEQINNNIFPYPKPAVKLIVEYFNLIKSYSKFLSTAINSISDITIVGKKELPNLIALIKQLYYLCKNCCEQDALKEFMNIINSKIKGLTCCISLALLNNKQQNDPLWNALQKQNIFIDIDLLYQTLNELDLSEGKLKVKLYSYDKLRDYIKSENDPEYHQVQLLLERKNQVLYLQIIKYLLGIAKIDNEMRKRMQTHNWTEFLCQAKLNPISKQITTSYLKQLLQLIIQDNNYHQVKDTNLYKSQLKILQKDLHLYTNKQLVLQALQRIQKCCKKRPQIWKQFCDENVINIIKKLIKEFPKETLEIFEIII